MSEDFPGLETKFKKKN